VNRVDEDEGFVPGRWWRVTYADGRTYETGPQQGRLQVWCETSDEQEAREAAARCPGGGVLSRLFEYRASEWRAVTP
jgi:hypothetical protein